MDLTRNLRDLRCAGRHFEVEKGVMQNSKFVPFKKVPEIAETYEQFKGDEKRYIEAFNDYSNLKKRYEGYKVWGKKRIREAFKEAWRLREIAEESRLTLILDASMYSDYSVRFDEIGRILTEEN